MRDYMVGWYMAETGIINIDYWYENEVDTTLMKNPLTQADWQTKIDDPFFEIAGLSFYSMPWAVKYILNTELAPYQCAILYLLWSKKYPLLLASRGGSKTFLLAVYCILRGLFDQGSKVVVVSSTFRQAKHVFEEINNIWKRAPLLRACVKSKPHKSVDYCEFVIGESRVKFLPMGNGEGIRGERASHVIVDEIDSVNAEVMHVVVRGFAATQLDPMTKIKEAARRKRDKEDVVRLPNQGNQLVIAGTAGFEGGNFSKLYNQYRKIVLAKAQGYGYQLVEELGEDFGDVWIDHRDYGLIKLPWRFIPEGMLDRDMIANARMTMSDMLFDMEYNCKFADASKGFFKHKDIMDAVGDFMVQLEGKPRKRYVMGVDPARTSDAFAISILEINGTKRRFVYCYSYRNKPFSFGANKIRELVKAFNVELIGMDAGGGGLAVKDFLETPEMVPQGEKAILDIEEDNHSKEGVRLLSMINFNPKWIEEANFLLQKNIEDGDMQFPTTVLHGKRYRDRMGPMEDTYQEIEECKREMEQISVTQTATGLRHFDIQASIDDKKRKIKPRKDRYSSLLIANAIARELADHRDSARVARRKYQEREMYGGWVEDLGSQTY
jgi:hypothetical protein